MSRNTYRKRGKIMRVVNNLSVKFVLVVLVGHALVSSSCLAVDVPELVTDRPDQTESSSTVPYGSIQIEMGWLYSDEDSADLETDTFPQALLRCGLAENLELRFGYDGYIWQNAVGSRAGALDDEGGGDLSAGFKVELWNEEGWRPETAFISNLGLPTGKGPFSSERFDPDYRLAFSHTLSDRFSLGYNLGQAWRTEEDAAGDRDTRHDFIYTAALGVGLTEKLGGFVEFFGDIPTGSNGGPTNSLDGGFTFLIADNLQLDISSGIGLSGEADDWFVSAGFSIRFP
jgi:hypothetical protein